MIDWTGILILLAFFGRAPVTLIIVYYYAFKSAKKRDKERRESVIKETEDSVEEVLARALKKSETESRTVRIIDQSPMPV